MTTETPPLEFVTKRSRTEVWWVWLKSVLLGPTFLVGCAVALLGGLYFTIMGNDFYRGIGLFALGWVLLAPLMYSLAIWRVIAKDPTVTAPTTVSIFSWGTHTHSDLRSVSLTWDNFDSFVETRDLIIVRFRPLKQFTIFPKRDLDSVQQTTLLAILSQHLRRK